MTAYGAHAYGTTTYGYFIPPVYRVDPFTAMPYDYSSISLSWTKPSGTIFAFRVVKNMFGFPTDQDDGEVILDSLTNYPGDSFTDTMITPGAYHYYGFYSLVNTSTDTWIRSGLTGCLMPANDNSGEQMLGLIPSFYLSTVNVENELQADPDGNPFLVKFMSVIGWGMDYLRTQYDTYLNLNDPWKIPVNDLYNLAGQLDLNINPDIHPYTLRKAIYNNAIVNQYRGTNNGIEMELSSLTGWEANLTTGQNIMLDDDQSAFLDPSYPAWSKYIDYTVGERVLSGNAWYQCILIGNRGTAPPNATYWTLVSSVHDTTILDNPTTGNPSTWEVIYPSNSNGAPTANAIYEVIGVADPLNLSSTAFNALGLTNTNGSTIDIWARSVSRTIADMAIVTTTFATDQYQAIADGIPVPYISFAKTWSATVRYNPQDIVLYNNQPFQALRASLNSVPPYSTPGFSSQDWAPLGFDDRFRICISARVEGSTTIATTPFVEWYDNQGNYITRVFARTPNSTVAGLPDQFCFDSFVTGVGSTLSGRVTDDTVNYWTQQAGSFTVSPFSGGNAYPTASTTRSIATTTSVSANGQVGLTFTTSPAAGWSTGLLLRYVSNTSYLRADMTTLKQNNGGVITTLGTYSTPCVAGDRLLVTLNGTTITVFRNNVQVLQVTSSFNQSSAVHGIINELT